MYSISLFVATIVAIILYTVGSKLYGFYLFHKRVNQIPGPSYAIPFFGILYDVMMKRKEDRLGWFKGITDQYKDGFFRIWIGLTANVNIHKPEHIEVILRSNTQITKSDVYEYVHIWLGRGLVTSDGAQWFHDRKLLTPAFHFSILDDFAKVMIDKAAILNSCIERQIKLYGDKPFDISKLGVKCALDIICETAMGTDVRAQEDIESQYIRAIYTLSTGAMYRFFRPWLKADWIFYRTALGKSFKAAIDTVQDLCTHIIVKKQKKRKLGVLLSAEDEVLGNRKRKAFLDLLLEANDKEDNPLTMEEIRNQTNTFMFAVGSTSEVGHDTTAALFNWTIFCLGNELDVQKKVHEELDDIIGDSDDLTLKILSNLKYLERVIKEVLRLYPSLTSVGRKMTEDMQIGDYIVPAGAMLTVQIYQLHRDPEVWPNPLRFDPDRFLPENVKNTAPVRLRTIQCGSAKLHSVKSVEKLSTIKMYSDIILRPVDGIYVTIKKRTIGVKNRG